MHRPLFVLIAVLITLNAIAAELPRMKALGERGETLWVSSDSLSTPSGELNLSGLPDTDAEMIRNYSNTATDAGCIRIGGVIYDTPNDASPGSFDQALSNGGFIVEGQATGMRPGFYRGVPGNLVEITVLKTYRDIEVVGPKASNLFIFFPVGDFTVGKYHFCKTDERYPSLPHVGDSVYFSGGPPLGRDRDVLHVRHGAQVAVVDKTTDTVHLTGDLTDHSNRPRTEAALRQRIAEVVR